MNGKVVSARVCLLKKYLIHANADRSFISSERYRFWHRHTKKEHRTDTHDAVLQATQKMNSPWTGGTSSGSTPSLVNHSVRKKRDRPVQGAMHCANGEEAKMPSSWRRGGGDGSDDVSACGGVVVHAVVNTASHNTKY